MSHEKAMSDDLEKELHVQICDYFEPDMSIDAYPACYELIKKFMDQAKRAMFEKTRERVKRKLADYPVGHYVDGYELRADDADYVPNENEALLISDAIYGLLSLLNDDLTEMPYED